MIINKFKKAPSVRKCQVTGKEFTITKDEESLYRSFGLPLPTMCGEERLRRKLAFVNLERFISRTCDLTGVKLFSVYPRLSQFPVYEPSAWWGKELDPSDYAREFDFGLLFIEQLLELWRSVPRPAYVAQNVTESSAVHYVDGASDCHFLFLSSDVSNCHYSRGLTECRSCMDCYHLSRCAKCYESIHCIDSSFLRFCESSVDCKDSWFLSGCRDCESCLFCSNLEGKKHYVFNEHVGEHEYEKILKDLKLNERETLEHAKEKFQYFLSDKTVPHIVGENIENCSGNYLWDCKDMSHSFDCTECSSSRLVDSMYDSTLCLDGVGYGRKSSYLAQFALVGDSASYVRNSVECWGNVQHLDYCSSCTDSRYLFGCVGLRGKEYCILNMQYSKEEYFKLREQIIEHLKAKNSWGNFFPPGFCGLPYNLSAAQIYLPLNRAPAKLMGFRWDDEEDRLGIADFFDESGEVGAPAEHEGANGIGLVPENISDLEDRVTDENVYLCEISARTFKVFDWELPFYREMQVATPSRCFEQRHLERISKISRKGISLRTLKTWGFRKIETSFPANWHRPIAERKSK